ncbi:hypothetical protein BGX29_010364, partial [Mortierella sp. GBA35]
KFIRKMAKNWISEKIQVKMGDRLFDSRPKLPFLKEVPTRGFVKNTDRTVPLSQDKRFEIARRKSVSSGYLTGGGGGGAMMPSMPMTRPMSSMMDIEGTLIPMLSRPPEKHHGHSHHHRHQPQESVGHWDLYQ